MSKVSKAQLKVHESFIVVEGSGEFPLDMLRYDSCHPAEKVDSLVIDRSRRRPPRRRCVVLFRQSVSSKGPTHARWRSFAWTVLGVFDNVYDAKDLVKKQSDAKTHIRADALAEIRRLQDEAGRLMEEHKITVSDVER